MPGGAALTVRGHCEHLVSGVVKGVRKRLDALGEDPVVVCYQYFFHIPYTAYISKMWKSSAMIGRMI